MVGYSEVGIKPASASSSDVARHTSGIRFGPRKKHRARASAMAAREMPQEETMIPNQGTEMEGVEMKIGMDASVEANGPKEESKARTCGLG